MNITLRQLRIFMEVAQRASMINAADALHLTTPAISTQIKGLETQVGLKLFDRSSKHVSLSKAGEHFMLHARRILLALKEADEAILRFKRLDIGQLTIGLLATTEFFIPRLLVRFRDEYPGIEVKLRVLNNREQLIGLMDAGEIDLSVMGQLDKGPPVEGETFAANPLVFICPPQHPLLGRSPLSASALSGHVFVAREREVTSRMAMEAYFAKHQCKPKSTMEISSNETIKQAVMTGMGLALVSLQAISLELRHGLVGVLDLRDTPIMHAWKIAHLQSRSLSPAAQAFRHFIIDHGQNAMQEHNAMLLALAFKRKITLGKHARTRAARSNDKH